MCQVCLTPLAIALQKGHADVADLLKTYGASVVGPDWDDKKVICSLAVHFIVFIIVQQLKYCNIGLIY